MKDSPVNLVIITPVRNEAWILPRFLAVAERVADAIIVLDQNSTDGSIEICKSHPKVVLLQNPSSTYDEAQRQKILIDAARRLVPMPRVLLALDADEIVAANAPSSADWKRGLAAQPGTVLMIEKPTFLGDIDHVIRYPEGFPLGFVDDNSVHEPRLIHSTRVPMPAGAPQLQLDDVKILHYALLRPRAQAAKNRMYSVIENVAGTRHLFSRREVYRTGKDYSLEGPVQRTPAQWLAGWEQAGIDMRTVSDDPPHWQDMEVLRLFAEHGTRRFWLEDIWDQDWEACRQAARAKGAVPVPMRPVQPPPAVIQWMLRLPDFGYRAIRAARSRIRSPHGASAAPRCDTADQPSAAKTPASPLHGIR